MGGASLAEWTRRGFAPTLRLMIGSARKRVHAVSLGLLLLGASVAARAEHDAGARRRARTPEPATSENAQERSGVGARAVAQPSSDLLIPDSQVVPPQLPNPPALRLPPPPPVVAEPVQQAPEPDEPRVGEMPNRESIPTRVIDSDGVIVLSNRPEPIPTAALTSSAQPRALGSSAPATSTHDARGSQSDEADENVAWGLIQGSDSARVKRAGSETKSEGGFGWLWGLVGSALVLLVPIAALLNRGTRQSVPPASRRSARPSSGPPKSSPGAKR